jgi:hypothetical protein
MADINTLSANQLTKDQYAARAGVGVDQIQGDFGSYTVGSTPTVSPITPQSLAPASPIALSPVESTPPYPTSTLEPVAPLTETPQEEKASGVTSTLGNLYNSLLGKTSYQNEQNATFGVDSAQKNINDLSAQLTGLKNEAAAIPLQLQQDASKGGITTGVLSSQQDSRLRTNAIAALGVSSLLAASQGQLANAQALADKAVAQKYGPIEQQIAALQENLKLILSDPLTSLQDKNRAQVQLNAQQAKSDAVALAKVNAKEIWDVATTAATNAKSFRPTTQYKTLATTLQAISAASTKELALKIAAETGLVKSPASSTSPTTPTTPKFNYNSATTRFQAVGIPVTSLNKDGTVGLSYRRDLLNSGLDSKVIDWLWQAVIDGNQFDQIREQIRNSGADPKILDTFVQTLQK